MATITATHDARKGWETWTWTAITSGDTASAVDVGGNLGAIYFGGTFDSATVVMKGSLNGSNYVAMTDPQGNALSKTAEALEQFEERVRFMQPTHSGGSGSQSLTIVVFIAKGDR